MKWIVATTSLRETNFGFRIMQTSQRVRLEIAQNSFIAADNQFRQPLKNILLMIVSVSLRSRRLDKILYQTFE